MKHISVFVLSLLFLFSCKTENYPTIGVVPESNLTPYQRETIAYFKEVALGFDSTPVSEVTRRWNEPVRVFIDASEGEQLRNELNSIISEIQTLLVENIDIQVVEERSNANLFVFIGSGNNYVSNYDANPRRVENSWAYYEVTSLNGEISKGQMYVDIERASGNTRRHLLREEFTQALGLGRESGKYPDSIFYQPWSSTIQYSELDKELIRLLYHPKMKENLTAFEVEAVITEIYERQNTQ